MLVKRQKFIARLIKEVKKPKAIRANVAFSCRSYG